MAHQGLDTKELLRERKRWLQEEIRQVDLALVAMGIKSSPLQRQDDVKNKPFEGIQWSTKIDEVFANYDGELNLEGVCKRLVGLGVKEAQDKKYRPSINTCLARKVKQERLERTRPGFYRKRSRDVISSDQTEEIK